MIYGNTGRYYDYYPPYDPYSYDPYYYGAPYNTSYFSVNFGVYPEYSGYYNDYDAYSYNPDPYYPVDYEPYDPSYYDPYDDDGPYVSNYDPYYGYPTPLSYDYEPFAYYTEAGYPDPFIDDGDYCSLGGGHFENALPGTFTQLLASGYDQGYSDGLYARRKNYGDRYYYDPYVYEDSGYDPYSYSLGENRRCLSEGYQLGYRDALYGSDQYEPLEDGNVDLVSLLMGNVLQTVNYSG